jgi:phosphatidylglycerol---prolipoprotein diacylglyceryl transferase
MQLHGISPFLWRFSDTFGVQWNGLSLMLTILISLVFVSWMVFRQRAELPPRLVGDFVLVAALGALVGARLGYCMFFSPDLFLKFRAEFPFWGVLAVNEGGMSSLGGVIGGFLACTVFAIQTGVSRLYLYDLMAITAPIGFFLGRVASFMSGELLGREVHEQIPFAFKFPTEIYYWPEHQFSKLGELEPVVEKVGVTADQWKALLSQYSSDGAAQASVQGTLEKIITTLQNGSSELANLIEPLLVVRHPVQLYAALAEGLFLFLFLFIFWYRPRRPGVVASTFLILYSAIHIGIETYAMPGMTGAGQLIMGLARDQWLSVGGLVIGIVCWFMWNRSEILLASGWGRGQNVKLHRR